jgi:hypothetical protein
MATPRDQHLADTRHVIPSVKNVPMTIQVYLEPGGEIHRAVWEECTDFTQVPSAIACRNVQAAAECDGEVRVITADAGPSLKASRAVFVARACS